MQQPSRAITREPDATATRTPAATYTLRAEHFGALRDSLSRRSAGAGNRSVALFFGVLLALVLAVWNAQPWFVALAALLLLGFVASFARQGQLNRAYRRSRALAEAQREGLARLARQWDALPLRQPPGEDTTPPLATDLDLLGRASLQHLLDSATMGAAQRTLRGWLLAPAPAATIRARQAAVRELAPQLDFREELGLGGRLMGEAQAGYSAFLAWAEDAPWLSSRPVLLWLARALTALTLALLAAQIAGLFAYPIFLLPVVANVALLGLVGKAVDRQLDRIADRQSAFAPYADLYHLIAAHGFEAPELRRVQALLAEGPVRGDVAMRRLDRLMRFTDLRLSLFNPILQALTLWNIHCLALLEGWRRQAGPSARAWLEALAQMEALSALATLSFEQPAWAFPEITVEGAARLEARGLGHPLLPDAARVGNDVAVGPPGSFLLVTGSNMSGKSTLLRALGVNVVLAQMGAPVCAEMLRLPPLRLATSIRVRDSLEQGISYFLAELRRIKLVVDAADAAERAGGPVVLYLLDEILHGTNSAERRIAARRILRHLLRVGAIGAASTHDLALADAPDLIAAAELVHFTERFTDGVEGPLMSFDYRLRPGLATSSNALGLMRMVGLDLRADEPS